MTDTLAGSSQTIGTSHRGRWCIAAGVAAAVIGVLAFLLRFNALGGALGGFDNDHFIFLLRTDMLLQGEQPLRNFADAELRGAWPALSYLVSAWAQQLGGRTLLPEAYLTVGALALGYALVFLLALDLSKRWTMAALAAAAAIAMAPKLYNYPKVLMLALGVYALRGAVKSPSRARLGVLAAVTVAAALFRHDLGLYVGVSTVAALAVRDLGRWPVYARTIGQYALLTGMCALPSLVWIQMYGGIPSYIEDSLASVAVERARTGLTLPALDFGAPLAGESLLLITYYAFWAVPALAAGTLLWSIARSLPWLAAPEARGLAVGLLVMGLLVNWSFLRANLAGRFGDAAVPVVLLAASAVGSASAWPTGFARTAAMTLPYLLVIHMLGAAYSFSEISRELDTAGLSDSWGKTARRYETVRSELGGLPPATWSERGATTVMQAAGYVARCTSPQDHLLVTGAIHEIPVLAKRRFAAGQALFKLSFYTSERDQRRAVAMLERQSVPIVLVDAREFEGGFPSDYPLVAAYLDKRYRHVGTIEGDGDPGVIVFADTRRTSVRRDSYLGLPCFR